MTKPAGLNFLWASIATFAVVSLGFTLWTLVLLWVLGVDPAIEYKSCIIFAGVLLGTLCGCAAGIALIDRAFSE